MLRILLFSVALVAGGSAAWVAFALQPRQGPATAVAEPAPPLPTQKVLVAAGDVAQGQTLSRENLRWQTWPEEAISPGFISRSARPDALETLQGAIVRSRIVAGEPIREEKLVNTDSGYLAAILPAGQRAVAVRVSAENTAGGFILPNDRVDVLHTVQRSGDGQSASESRTILRNVRVLAIDQMADETSSESAAAVGKTATLELTPEQAEVIAAAEASGSLSLALRSAADADETDEPVRRTATAVRIVRGGRIEIVKVN